MWKRAVLLSLGLSAMLAAPVSAQDEDPDSAPTAIGIPGEDHIEVTGEGCPPEAAVDYSWVFGIYGTRSSPPPVHRGSTTADTSGNYAFTITDLYPGAHWNVAVECGGGRTELDVYLATADTTPATADTTPATADTTPTTADTTPTTAASGALGGSTDSTALPRTGPEGAIGLGLIGVAALLVGGVATFAARGWFTRGSTTAGRRRPGR